MEEQEIKTIYGTFVEELQKYEAMPLEPISPTESAYDKIKKHRTQLRKMGRIVQTFPESGIGKTKRFAEILINYFEYSLFIIEFGFGVRTDIWQRDYYQRLRDRIPDAVQKWKEHATTLELSMKPLANTIE